MRPPVWAGLLAGLLVGGCPSPVVPDPGDTGETDAPVEPDPPSQVEQPVLVTLDGAPVAGATVRQPGLPAMYVTDQAGRASVTLRLDVSFEVWVTASHPEARIDGARVREPGDAPVTIALKRYDTSDNPDYVFQDPGTPFRNDTTNQCAHCHLTINEDWYGSEHAGAASNSTVLDLYAGTSARTTRESCEAAGGRWEPGPVAGSDEVAPQCYIGPSVVADLDPDCDGGPCEGPPANAGGCADCHAPAIDGALGGRDLLEARGIAFEAGVHCDVCHKVESVHLDRPPGVGGRLGILRPSEPGVSQALGVWEPLTFGPHHDVPNPRMGSVQRDHFNQATLCAGCHEDVHAPRMPGAEVDPARWPDGTLPIQTTYSEWRDGPLGSGTPCQSCHMPPDPRVKNGADLQEFEPYPGAGDLAAGWPRPAGAVRRHTFVGPRHPEGRMLELSAALDLRPRVVDGALVADVGVRNVGPGHALPTGEPMRHLVLRVRARCGDRELPAIGGDAVPDIGGASHVREAGEDWSRWPGAQVGQRIRVVARTGEHHDYAGWGPFGDGTFTASQKGMPVEQVVADVAIAAVDGDRVTLERSLPEGDRAYLVGGAPWPVDGEPAGDAAGAAGFAFARVTVDQRGQRQVAAHRAVDVASDNRLLPGQGWTSQHRFDLQACATPVVDAALTWRAYPLPLARQKNWHNPERVMVTASRQP